MPKFQPFAQEEIDKKSPLYLPLDEAIASRAVFVNVSGSDGRAGRKRVWGQLTNFKMVRDSVNGELIGIHDIHERATE